MKISLIGPVYPYRGGIAHFTTVLAQKLMAAGHTVQVISFKNQYPKWLYPGKSDKDFSPGRERVDAEYVLSPLNVFSWRNTVRKILAFEPDRVIIPWWVTFWGPAIRFLLKKLGDKAIPVTMLIHNTLPHEARPVDRLLTRHALSKAERFIVMTNKEKRRLINLLPGIETVNVVPHPVYQILKPTALTKEEARAKLNLPATDNPIILFFGFIRPYKGLGVLISALELLNNQGMEAHLLVAGEFWQDRQDYDRQIEAMGLGAYVHIFDRYIPDDQVGLYFKAADVFVAPYTGGTQSGALKTALGFGLPAVVTDVIADEMALSMADRCRVAPAGKAEALAKGIEEVLCVPVQGEEECSRRFEESWNELLDVLL